MERPTLEALGNGQLWLSLGMHNIVIFSHEPEITTEIEQFCHRQNIEMEKWVVTDRDGRKFLVNDIQYFSPSDYVASGSRVKKTRTAKKAYDFPSLPTDDPLSFTIIELYALLSVIEGRSKANFTELSDDCFGVEEQISQLLAKQDISSNIKRDMLLGLNAGLSRLASQAFSGTTPISRTECHFWPHSLLGIGVANFALRNVTDFVTSCVRDSLFNEKYEALKALPFDPLLPTAGDAKKSTAYFRLDRETIASTSSMALVSPERAKSFAEGAIVNPITYYSGRDGFRNGLFTTSAPLMSVSGCNSVQWNLGTITHELSHRIISGKLEELFEAVCADLDRTNAQDMDAYYEVEPKTVGEFGQKLLAMSLAILNSERYPDSKELDEVLHDPLQFVVEAKLDYSEEIEEISVHIFDYFHFYGLDKVTYVNFIWQSWAVQPAIELRLMHYVCRTVTALAVAHFRLEDWKERAISDFESVLTSEPLKSSLPFYEKAKELLDDPETRGEISNYLQQMAFVITLFHYMFKSDDLRALAMADPYRTPVTTKATTTDGTRYQQRHNYTALRLTFADDSARLSRPSFANPLLFLRDFSTDPSPNSAKSAWLLHMLSFNKINPEGDR